jgi:hypothetical protein
MPICNRCGTTKGEHRWFPISERWSKACLECRVYAAEKRRIWRDENLELANELSRESTAKWRAENPELDKATGRYQYHKHSPEEKREIWATNVARMKAAGTWDGYSERKKARNRAKYRLDHPKKTTKSP